MTWMFAIRSFQALWMKLNMSKCNVAEVSGYLCLIASSTVISFFYGVWKLSHDVVPTMNFDKCFSVWLNDYFFNLKYQITDQHLPESLGVEVEALDFPEPKYHIDNQCLAELFHPIADALVMGFSFGVIFSVLLCAANHAPRPSLQCFAVSHQRQRLGSESEVTEQEVQKTLEEADQSLTFSPINKV